MNLYKFAYIILTIVLIAGLIPSVVIAWQTTQSAQTECSLENTASIKVSFTNKEPTRAMNAEVKDEQTGQKINLGAIDPGQTKTGEIATNKDFIMDGEVKFFLTWTNGDPGSDNRSTQYNSITCAKPTPTSTPNPTPTVSPTPTNIPTPTLTPTSTPVPTISPTTTPTPTITPKVTPTPTTTPTPIITSTTVNNVTNNNTTNIQVQPTPVSQVLAAVDVKELPKTGANPLSLIGLLSLFPLGIFLRNKGLK